MAAGRYSRMINDLNSLSKLQRESKNDGKNKIFPVIALLTCIFLAVSCRAALTDDMEVALHDCLFKAMQKADDVTTVGELKAACQSKTPAPEIAAEQESAAAEAEETALQKRFKQEEESKSNLWTIMPHRPNYILLGNYNFSSMNDKPYEDAVGTDVDLNSTEVKFQISFKFMLWENLFKKRTNGDLFFDYTQLAMR